MPFALARTTYGSKLRRETQLETVMSLTYLHTMVRVKDLEKTIAFFELLGLKETRRMDSEKGRFSLIFLAPPGQEECPVELTYNWDGDEDLPSDGRHFGHLALSLIHI